MWQEEKEKSEKEGGKETGMIARVLVPVMCVKQTIAVRDCVGQTTGACNSDKEKLIFRPVPRSAILEHLLSARSKASERVDAAS
eukprot:6198459-Pleurochrysis_carterae.AAC.2